MDTKTTILQIALPTPLRQIFDYTLPDTLSPEQIKIGIRVKVPFGQRQSVGVIIGITDQSLLPPKKLKAIIEILDTEELFNAEMLSLYQFASEYYHHPIGDVIFSSFPPALRDGTSAQLAEDILYTLTEQGANASESLLKHAVQQQKIIHLLRQHPNGLRREEIIEAEGQVKALTALLAKGFIRKYICNQPTLPSNKATSIPLPLNEHQKQAVDAIINQKGFMPFLLEGITGSGKTEVYLACIDHILKKGQQALVLVPEIGLTPQTVARFQARFSVPISVLHSNLNDKDRTNAWLSAYKGIARIIIGTRSAILTPLPKLGIIILDEEHDASFKQQSGFRYSAKDLAIMRAKQASIPILLGSATPCLESLYNVKQQRFQHLTLPKRAGNATEPTFHIVDVRNQKLEEGFSTTLFQRMGEHISKGGQILVFLNRRGYAPTLLCHHCGWMAHCSRCDARVTYHAYYEKLICHHCTSEQIPPKECQSCRSSQLLFLGLGTQRLEKMLSRYFPKVPIARIDRDSTRRKGSLEKMLSTIQTAGSKILVGTQMLAKGHHFPDVTMVAIVDVDNSLFSSDFRASERLGQVIVQVAGRAGRSDKPGEVYLQTHYPTHPLLSRLIHSGYVNFAESLLNERKSAELPPYSHLALFRAEGKTPHLPHLFLDEVKNLLKPDEAFLELLGPIPALMEKKAGKFRAQLLIQAKNRRLLQKTLTPKIYEIEKLSSARKVKWSIDIDPLDIF